MVNALRTEVLLGLDWARAAQWIPRGLSSHSAQPPLLDFQQKRPVPPLQEPQHPGREGSIHSVNVWLSPLESSRAWDAQQVPVCPQLGTALRLQRNGLLKDLQLREYHLQWQNVGT